MYHYIPLYNLRFFKLLAILQIYISLLFMTDVDKWLEQVQECKPIPESAVRKLCNMVKNILID